MRCREGGNETVLSYWYRWCTRSTRQYSGTGGYSISQINMPPRGHSSHDKGKGKIHSDEKDESGSSRIDQSIAGKQESFGSGVTPDRSWDGVGRASSLNLAYPTEDNERARSSSNEINWGSSQSSQDSDHDARNVAIFGSQVGTTASQWVTGFAASCSSCGLDVAQKCAKELERIAMEMDAVAPAAENAEGRLKAIVSESLSRIAARQPPDCPGVDISACLVTVRVNKFIFKDLLASY